MCGSTTTTACRRRTTRCAARSRTLTRSPARAWTPWRRTAAFRSCAYAEQHPDFVFEAARIVSWGTDSWSNSFTIAKGEADGLEEGDCVITEDGLLVGQVEEVGENSSTVATLVDVDTSVGALVGEDGAEAMLLGDYALMPLGQARLAYPTEGAQLFLEEHVYTSAAAG